MPKDTNWASREAVGKAVDQLNDVGPGVRAKAFECAERKFDAVAIANAIDDVHVADMRSLEVRLKEINAVDKDDNTVLVGHFGSDLMNKLFPSSFPATSLSSSALESLRVALTEHEDAIKEQLQLYYGGHQHTYEHFDQALAWFGLL
eukprot:TRINITY_DN6261_c0_g1_i1.p1 TRINITY_DN6261_c0_g1~~TRINITY_DN6261_c0_g1_i1.p1  ORF type:complete len:147 (-),score=38.51 TRINITY_DN6261_c0_g1_i1:183-623(-)